MELGCSKSAPFALAKVSKPDRLTPAGTAGTAREDDTAGDAGEPELQEEQDCLDGMIRMWHDYMRQPDPLQQLCRMVVRDNIQTLSEEAFAQLPLPSTMQGFLHMGYLCDEDVGGFAVKATLH